MRLRLRYPDGTLHSETEPRWNDVHRKLVDSMTWAKKPSLSTISGYRCRGSAIAEFVKAGTPLCNLNQGNLTAVRHLGSVFLSLIVAVTNCFELIESAASAYSLELFEAFRRPREFKNGEWAFHAL